MIHYEGHGVTLHHGDCLDVLRTLPDSSVDSVVTDPPYGLEFMGKDWDRFGAARSKTTAARVGEGAMTGGAGITATGYTDGAKRINRPAFGGARPTTFRCDECGKRDQFRNDHGHGGWTREVIDPTAPAPSAAFGEWCELWAAECLRVLKPGGHLLAFGGTRTWHRLACAVEDAGFEVRDSLAWLYGSGFPKSLDVSKAIDKAAGAEREVVGKRNRDLNWRGVEDPDSERYADTRANLPAGSAQGHVSERPRMVPLTAPATDAAREWAGWGTALKPAFEPVVVARKPLGAGTVAANVLAHGTGALNVDGCRIDYLSESDRGNPDRFLGTTATVGNAGGRSPGSLVGKPMSSTSGRWPANVVLDEDMAGVLDQQSGTSKDGVAVNRNRGDERPMTVEGAPRKIGSKDDVGYGGQGGASRFFYVAKAPKRERPVVDGVAHPTVKPLALMRWLVRLVTPPGGTVLEPFAGSGTTVEACIVEGFRCIAIEKGEEYLPLILARIARHAEPLPEAPELVRQADPQAAIVEQVRTATLFEFDGEAS